MDTVATNLQGSDPKSTKRFRRPRLRLVIATLMTVATVAVIAPSAGATTVPYATVGTVSCADGNVATGGSFTASNPAYMFPANPALAARWPGELDYYFVSVQLYTTNGWQTVGNGRMWRPIYANYQRWSPSGDGENWDIFTTGYYRAVYWFYWTPTGQQSPPVYSGYCHIYQPAVNTNGWGMY